MQFLLLCQSILSQIFTGKNCIFLLVYAELLDINCLCFARTRKLAPVSAVLWKEMSGFGIEEEGAKVRISNF